MTLDSKVMPRRLTLVEDDDVIRENYAEILRDEGFEVEAFGSRAEALHALRRRLPDVALIDISLGEEREGGFRLCADLRQLAPTLPIIFLTAHTGEVDRISGLRLGADDYLTKDVSVEYLLVRIEALLHRFQTLMGAQAGNGAAPAGADRVTGGAALTIDGQRSVAYWRGQPLDLTLTQFWILQALATAPGQVRHHAQLMRAANIVVEPNTIAAHVKTIRDRFRALDPAFDAIRTERGVGYRWVDPDAGVTCRASPADS